VKRIEHPIDRFWRKVAKGDGCWMWLGGRFDRGYGRFNPEGKISVRAHRYAWEVTNGPIPDGLIVCHRCDVPLCVNPAHLFLGTHKDNAQDRERKGRGIYGERHPRAKLGRLEVAEIRALRAQGLSYRAIGNRFGVTAEQAGNVARWRHWTR
jgi:hypothetical protein